MAFLISVTTAHNGEVMGIPVKEPPPNSRLNFHRGDAGILRLPP
ncbi:MAG: hypothetical protein QF406_14075 [Verrucomicrobiota bacterium]|nr:hypothetical protein [Verrucomicrobiota bacterium]